MSDTMEFQAIATKVAKAEQDVARAEGNMESIMDTLQKNYNCSTIEEAEKLLASMKEQIDTLSAKRSNILEKLKGLKEW